MEEGSAFQISGVSSGKRRHGVSYDWGIDQDRLPGGKGRVRVGEGKTPCRSGGPLRVAAGWAGLTTASKPGSLKIPGLNSRRALALALGLKRDSRVRPRPACGAGLHLPLALSPLRTSAR